MPFQFRKEAIEEDLNTNFPSQGQGNPPLYYSLSEVVVPTYSINNVAEGSSLPENLQTAWDFSTGHQSFNNTSGTIITGTGFWQIGINSFLVASASTVVNRISLSDGITSKVIFEANASFPSGSQGANSTDDKFVVYVRSGDSVSCLSTNGDAYLDVWYRQIADVNGNLVNPLGFSFA